MKIENPKVTLADEDVVQLYCSAPYTSGEIEKPYEVLCGFAKTDWLELGESDVVTIEFDPYTAASYDYDDANGNGHSGYEREEGNYSLFIASNAHDRKFTVPFNVGGSGIKYTDAENRFGDADDQLYNGVLSRADWDGTWLQTRTEDERDIDASVKAEIDSKETNNPTTDYTMPTTDAIYWEEVEQEDGIVVDEAVTYKLKELSVFLTTIPLGINSLTSSPSGKWRI